MQTFRIGHGYDVHRLAQGRRLIIGGVDIPFEKGLVGHSDADVLTHAIIDSMLGALALGDIGRHFPDTDNTYKDISSLVLLERSVAFMRQKGYEIGNIDATIIAQRPKLLPHIPAMLQNLYQITGAAPETINLKATTEEKLGFTGREEGISAHAVCVLSQRA